MNGGDVPLTVTFFTDRSATTKRERQLPLEELAELIRQTRGPSKEHLPCVKLATFGEFPSEKGSLRWDGNVQAQTGIEADYDGEQVSFDDAVAIAEKAGLFCLIYTSPSHRPDASRWRVLCPTSSEILPAERGHMLGRLNGLYRGIFAAESWTLSQSYYFGRVNGNDDHQALVVDGMCIDQLHDLDRSAIGKPATASVNGNGADHAGGGPVDEAMLLEQIKTGKAYHLSCTRLLGLWAIHGVPLLEAKRRLVAAFEAVSPADRDARWRSRFADIDRCLFDIYGKEAARQDAKDGLDDLDAPELEVEDAGDIDSEPIPPREWIFGNRYCLGFVSGNIGNGGVGKTALAIVDAASISGGRSLTGEHLFRQENVLIVCLEDQRAEIAAASKPPCCITKLSRQRLRGGCSFAPTRAKS